ncbi:hypothetical protein, partial [Streptomyces prunicolor]|uniref:hypothetical protein n=1 Tax=Streptomyces prunicolor TaxID=67348 RepID=UPI0033E77716
VQFIRSPGLVDASEGIGSPFYTSKDGKYYFYVVKPKGSCIPNQYDQTQYLAAVDELFDGIKNMEELSN